MKEPVRYRLFDPTGNITLLVETPVPVDEQPAVAQALMDREPSAEQVGFLTITDNRVRLRMAGGEFCGNACMSAAALYMEQQNRPYGAVSVSVCGTEHPVLVEVTQLPEGDWQGRVQMPQPLSVCHEKMPDGRILPVVRFPGITHVILEEVPNPASEALACEWGRHLDAEALGLMFLNHRENSMKPLVYVPAAGTLFWEASCASGTTAVGALTAAETGRPVDLALVQPGGTLRIQASPDGPLYLCGRVRILK